MNKLWTIFLLAGLLLAGCISISPADETPTGPPQFVTSTLPPTKALVLPSTITPSTPDVDLELTGTLTLAATSPPDCKVQAVLLEDVTVPDNTRITAGETFTKTWRFKNTGTCHWKGYTISFLTGDRMSAPDSAPIPETLAGSTVDVSLELMAPMADGSYSGYFSLKDDQGEAIDVGTEKTFWLKIVVGSPGTPKTATPRPRGTPTVTSSVSISNATAADCSVSQDAGIASQIAALINDEREANGLPALALNHLLANAAQTHSVDMACHDLLSHTGSDGSYVFTRITATGYSATYTEEIIYAGSSPQAAIDWWMSDKLHRDAILSARVAEMGVGYAYLSTSSYGGYITVDFASP
jgi:uncharacterized protein YkwD